MSSEEEANRLEQPCEKMTARLDDIPSELDESERLEKARKHKIRMERAKKRQEARLERAKKKQEDFESQFPYAACKHCHNRTSLQIKKEFCSENCYTRWDREEKARTLVLPCRFCDKLDGVKDYGGCCSADCKFALDVRVYKYNRDNGIKTPKPKKMVEKKTDAEKAVSMF
jgi:hypothetical protein